MMRKSSRREFLQLLTAGMGGVLLVACGGQSLPSPASPAPAHTVPPEATQPPVATYVSPPDSVATPTKPPKPGPTAPIVKSRGKNATPVPGAAVPMPLESQILGRPSRDSITLSLLAASDRQVNIAYRTKPGDHLQRTAPLTLKANVPQNVELAQLQADTQYFYQVEGGGAPSEEHTFRTQRAPGQPFVFTIEADPHYGEQGFNGEVYAASLSNALADRPDFHINLGDTFMTEKRNPQSLSEAEIAFAGLRPYFGILGPDAPIFLVNGNHEGELGWLINGRQKDLPVWCTQLRQRYYPNPAPGGFYTGSTSMDSVLGSVRDGYFAWTWGDALFLALDPFWYTRQKPQNNDLTTNWNWTLGKEQFDWLKSTLETSKSKYKFIFTHHLVGGRQEARGGSEYAHLFEWGGQNADGTDGFAVRRPGWGKPIHQLLVENRVNAVFHGHDHVFVRQELDGIIYQELPQPSFKDTNNARLAEEYGYHSGMVQPGSGHLRVTVQSDSATVEFVRASLPADSAANQRVDYKYTMNPR